jgi:hypothetical protein
MASDSLATTTRRRATRSFDSAASFCQRLGFDFDGLLADGDLGAAVDATAAD